MKRALCFVLAVVVTGVTSGCWEDWQRFFDPTPSTEHRIQDLRVLAVELLPVASRPSFLIVDLVDPRGGSARVEVRACLRPAELVPCVDKGVVLGTLEADFEDGEARAPLSLVNDDGDGSVEALAAAAGIVIDASPIFVDVIVDVVKVDQEPTEREVATVTIPVYNELRIADDGVDNFRTCINPEDPEQNPVCFGDVVPESFCGDNVVDVGEACEPPGIAGCNEFCQRADEPVCPNIEPACLVGTPQNVPPAIVGLRVDDAIDDDFTVPVADDGDLDFVVDVRAGDRLRIQPVVAAEGAFDTYQPWFVPFFDIETCGTALTAGCPTQELPSVRFYVEDGDVELAVPVEETGAPVNDRGATVADVVVGAGVSDDQPLWIVVVDGRGGMALQRVTLHLVR